MPLVKTLARERRKERIGKKIRGTPERPRLSVFRSVKHLHAQLIDDSAGRTLLGLSTLSKEFPASKEGGCVKGAKKFGVLFALKAKEIKISQVVFDRGGFLYHGRVKSFADGAREGGLVF